MANRRMISKDVIDTDDFLDMSLSTQALYFHLLLKADDDGFVKNPKRIMRMIGANDDEMKVLISKKYLLPFDSGVCVIKHWRLHNYIQSDRYKETNCKQEKKQLEKKNNEYYLKNEMDTKCIQNVSTGKDRIGKDRIGKGTEVNTSAAQQSKDLLQYFHDEYKRRRNYPPIINWSKHNKIAQPFIKQLGLETAKELVNFYFNSNGINDYFKNQNWSVDIFLNSRTLNNLMAKKYGHKKSS